MIEQTDREFAASICHWVYPHSENAGVGLSIGQNDEHAMVQLVALIRTTERKRIAKMLRETTFTGPTGDYHRGVDFMLEQDDL